MNTKTNIPRKEEIQRRWHLIDADGKVLGRLATDVANILMGKKKVLYTPTVDCGDFVVIINPEKIRLTGKKLDQKFDFRHSGYPGGDTLTSYRKMMEMHPDRVVRLAVQGMLPKNKLRACQLKRLKIHRGADHPHAAQFTVAQ